MAQPKASDVIDQYKDAKTQRYRHEDDWRLASAYALPRQYSSWNSEGPQNYTSGGQAAARRIAYDTTAMRALPKFMAILERICTPHNMKWQRLTASDPVLAANLHVRGYFDQLNNLLFNYRYEGKAMFIQAISEIYASLGVYGNGPVYIGQRQKAVLDQKPGFIYRACGMRDIFILVDDCNNIVAYFRRFFLNYRQFKLKFPKSPVPQSFAAADKAGKGDENTFVEFVHWTSPRDDYDSTSIGVNRHAVIGSFLCVPDMAYAGDEQGFRSMPYLMPRLMTEANDPYGFAPMAQCLPAAGTASQIKKTVIKQGQKAVDPVLLVHDDGIMNGTVDLRPGAQNFGGVDKQGRPLIHALPTGDFRVSDKLLADERDDINDAFFVKLFQLFMDRPEQKEVEVMEMIAEKAMIVAPVMGRITSELLSPCTEREIDMFAEMGLLPSMPPELVEAKGDYKTIYTSPMAMGMYAEEVSGFTRSVQQSLSLVEATQDPSYLDHYNFDTAIPEMAEYQAVPARWMNDPKTKAAIGQARAAKQQQQQLLENAAPLAQAAKTASTMQGSQAAQLPQPQQQGVVPQQNGVPFLMPGAPQQGGVPNAG